MTARLEVKLEGKPTPERVTGHQGTPRGVAGRGRALYRLDMSGVLDDSVPSVSTGIVGPITNLHGRRDGRRQSWSRRRIAAGARHSATRRLRG